MVKFIHTADIHLDSPLKGLEGYDDAPVDELRGATRRAFENLIDLALERVVDFILIAGDLYDGDWKDYNTGLFFAAQMGRLSEAGIRVFIVSGNHDAASQITKTMPLPDNVYVFSSRKPESVKLDNLDVVIHGQSYVSRAVSDNLAVKYLKRDADCFNIGLLHTSLTGREGHENYAPCSLDDLISKGYDYWALGHVHKREIVCEEPLIIFPGNIQGRHIRETSAKGATLVSVDDGGQIEIEECELDVLRWAICKLDIAECETKEAMYEKVRAALEREQDLSSGKTLALRLQLEGSCPVHAELHAHVQQITEEIRAIAASLGDLWLEKVKFKTSQQKNMAEIVAADSPLFDLLQSLEKLDFGGDTLAALVPELINLKAKLPAELFDEVSISESNPERLQELQAEVKDLLIAKLLQHGSQA